MGNLGSVGNLGSLGGLGGVRMNAAVNPKPGPKKVPEALAPRPAAASERCEGGDCKDKLNPKP